MKNERNNAAKDLIYLLSCAVNCEKPDKNIINQMDLQKVFELSQIHSLTAVAAYALEKTIPLPDDYKEAKYKAVCRQTLLNVERARVLKELEENKIWYLPLKGIVLKDYYPKSAMREMGDNDILCDSSKMPEIKALMEGLGFACTHYDKNHHDVYKKRPKLVFEMHRELFDQINHPEQYDYYNNIKDRLIKETDNLYGYHMSNEDYYIYLINHMFAHYRNSGTGLRSLIDIYVFYGKFGIELDEKYLSAELEKLNLAEFEHSIRELAVKAFTGGAMSEEEKKELEYFIGSGAQGTKENRMMQELGNEDSVSAKSKYLLSRVFPSRESLRKVHPLVYRHKILYLLWITYRPLKGAVTRPKEIIDETKRIKKFKKKDIYGRYSRKQGACVKRSKS